MPRSDSRIAAPACCAFAAICAFAPNWLKLFPDALGSAYIALHVLLSLLMLLIWWRACSGDARAPRWSLIAGIAALLLLLPAAPSTTHDPARYLWDGRVALAGLDPYRHAPDAPALARLRAQWPTPAEHATYPTLYPPAALATFAVSAALGPRFGPQLWKLLATGAAVASLLLIAALLRRRGLARHLPLIALSPLLILETGIGAHLDVFSLLAVCAALSALDRRWVARAGLALGIGALFKLLPMFALVAVAGALGWRRARPALLWAASVWVLGYALAFALGWHPLGSLPVFFERWRFGAPVFTALETLFADQALFVAAGLSLATLALASLRARRDMHAGLVLALAAPLLFSPVVFPWYLLPLLALLALRPSALLLALIIAAPLSYEVLDRFEASGLWQPAVWPMHVLALAGLIGLLIDLARQRRQRRLARTAAEVVARIASEFRPPARPTVVVAVIPAYNEAPAIRALVSEALSLQAQGRALFARVIVVDNNSSDGTGGIAQDAGATVVREKSRGYGAACLAGIAAAADAEVIVFVDGDASVDLTQTASLLAALERGADLVIGARREVPAGAMSLPQRFGNAFATALIRAIWRAPVSDLGPFRAIRCAALARLDMRDPRYGWTVEMQVKAIQRGLRVVEVPVRLRPRIGVSKISGTVSGVIGAGLGIVGTILRLWLAGRRASHGPSAARVAVITSSDWRNV